MALCRLRKIGKLFVTFLCFICMVGIFLYLNTFVPSCPQVSKKSYRSTLQSTDKQLLNRNFPFPGLLTLPKPGLVLGNIVKNATMIIGITTVKREGCDYLLSTISSLLQNQRARNAKVRIVVFIGETNQTYVKSKSLQIITKYKQAVDESKLQVISPPETFYPDWNKVVTRNLNDPIERVKWRSKQNLDQIFLMLHVHNLAPSYYLMMEDDVISKPGYDDTILQVAKAKEQFDWFHISFCNLGAIGKLYRNSMLAAFAAFIHTFWNKKPLDWLQIDYVKVANCGYDDTEESCRSKLAAHMLVFSPSLFQHVGKCSSLKGKTQELQDATFTKENKPQIN